MHIHNLSNNNSVLNSFLFEIRDETIQKDSLRFRRNIERIGEILAYGILISLGVYEMMRYQRVAKGKEQAQADTYARIHARIDGLHVEYEQLVAHLKERRLIPE